MNDIFQSYFLPAMLSLLSLVVISFSVITILMWDETMSNPGMLFILVGLINAVPIEIIVCTLSGKINKQSTEFLRRMVSTTVINQNDVRLRKHIRAMLQLKIRFGNNFIDMQTPLVMMNFCIVQIANTLVELVKLFH